MSRPGHHCDLFVIGTGSGGVPADADPVRKARVRAMACVAMTVASLAEAACVMS